MCFIISVQPLRVTMSVPICCPSQFIHPISGKFLCLLYFSFLKGQKIIVVTTEKLKDLCQNSQTPSVMSRGTCYTNCASLTPLIYLLTHSTPTGDPERGLSKNNHSD